MTSRCRSTHAFAIASLLVAACHHDEAPPKAAPPITSASSAPASPSALASASTTIAPPPPPAPPCLPKYAASGSVTHVEARGEHALVCFDSGASETHCVEVDPTTGAVIAASEWKGKPDEVAESGGFTAKASHLAVDVCPRSGAAACKHVVTPSDPLGVAVSDDGARAFAFIAEVKPGGVIPFRLFGEIYDTATGRRLVRSQITSTTGFTSDENVYFADFVGPALLLRDEMSDRSAGIMGLWDGRLSHATYMGPGPFVKLDGAMWASATHDEVTFYDVGKATASGKPLQNPSPSSSLTSNRAGLLVMGDRVLWAWSSPPTILTFDRKTHVAGATHALALCP